MLESQENSKFLFHFLWFICKAKSKVIPIRVKYHTMKTRRTEIQLYLLLFLLPDGGQWSAVHPQTPYHHSRAPNTHWLWDWEGPTVGLCAVVQKRKTSCSSTGNLNLNHQYQILGTNCTNQKQIPVFWDVMLGSWASISCCFEGLKHLNLQGQAIQKGSSTLPWTMVCLTLQIENLHTLKMPGTTYSRTSVTTQKTGIFSNTNVSTSNFTQQKLHMRSDITGAYSTNTKPPSIIPTCIIFIHLFQPQKLPKFAAFEVRYRH